MSYIVVKAPVAPDITAPFDSPDWSRANLMKLPYCSLEGSNYRPEVGFKLQYDDKGLYGLFQVHDCHVRCVEKEFNASVCRDSCMEFFVRPASGVGYENFEISGSGVMLCMHIKNPGRTMEGFIDYRFLTEDEVKDVKIFHTLPEQVSPESDEAITYRLGWFLPFSLFHHLNGSPVPVKGSMWRANVYKCGDRTSHPHWLSWSKVRITNFHFPPDFGQLIFD